MTISIKALAARISARASAMDGAGEGWAPAAFNEAIKNCGNGSGGFQPGNSCARGGDGGGEEAKEGGESQFGLTLDNKTAVNSENLARDLSSSGVKLGQVDDGIVRVGDDLHVEVTDHGYQVVSGTNGTNFEFEGKPFSSRAEAVSTIKELSSTTSKAPKAEVVEKGAGIVSARVGNKYSVILHPEHQEALLGLRNKESTSFQDETRARWTATRKGNAFEFQRQGDSASGKTPLQFPRSALLKAGGKKSWAQTAFDNALNRPTA